METGRVRHPVSLLVSILVSIVLSLDKLPPIYRKIVATNATARGLSGKAVMNMSLGGAKSNALNSAIAAVTRAGVTAVVAAGNENVSSDKNWSKWSS
jgi:subtilisin family serine protease